jgi:aminoglycoside phosphotransferase (APT) family kinase protein
VGVRDDSGAELAVGHESGASERVPALALGALERFLNEVGLGSGPIAAEPIGDGHSNLTYLIGRNDERWVLRRPPPGPLPPSAHDVLREFRILRACAGQVRVPTPIASCADAGVIGAPFFLMSHVEGEVMTTALPPGLDAETDGQRIGDELVAGLIEIHDLDWQQTDLADLTSSPGAYPERQLRRFSNLWQHNRTRELPVVDKVAAWLDRARPRAKPSTLVHGDYRLGNTIFSAESPARLHAVLDWELATIGDPLADLGYMTATWAVAGEQGDPLVRLGHVTSQPGFATRDELVHNYALASGRSVDGLGWYEVFALWKSAVFLEGSYARLLSGTTGDPFFASLEAGVPELADRAWELACRSPRPG